MTQRRALKLGLEIAVPIAILAGWQAYTVHLDSSKFPRLSTILVTPPPPPVPVVCPPPLPPLPLSPDPVCGAAQASAPLARNSAMRPMRRVRSAHSLEEEIARSMLTP